MDNLETLVEMAEASQKKVDSRFEALESKLEELYATRKTSAEPEDARVEYFSKYLRTGHVEQKYLLEGTGNVGGFLVPADESNSIVRKIADLNPVRQYANVIRTGSMKVNVPAESASFAAAWTTESGTRSTSAGLQFSNQTIDIFEQYVRIPVSNALLEDNAYDLEGFLFDAAARKFAELEGAAFVTGSGSGQPKGLTAGGSTVTRTASATAITVAEVAKLWYDLPAVYASNAVWMANRGVVAYLRQLKDNNAFVWQGVFGGQPDQLYGRPVLYTPALASTPAIDAYNLVVGDLKAGYTIADRLDVEVLRDSYSGAASGNTIFHFRRRVGGTVTQPDAFQILRSKAS